MLCPAASSVADHYPTSRRDLVAAGVPDPPCAGKTTYVAQRRGAADLIVDMDALRVALGSTVAHDADDPRLAFALAARDGILRRIREPHDVPAVWIVACAPRRWQRDIVPDAAVVVLDTSADECHRRADIDRPSLWHQLIDEWFRAFER